MTRTFVLTGMIAAALLTAGGAEAQTSRRSPSPQGQQCFRAADWRGWKATEDGASMYIDTGINRVWRFDFAQPCPELNSLGAQLVTRTDQPYICRPIDVNLRVARPGISISYCQVRRMTRLTPAQAKALPRRLRP